MTQTSIPLEDRPRFTQLLRVPKASFRIIPQIEKDPNFVAYVQLPVGRVALFVVMVALAALDGWLGVDFSVAPLAAACGWMQQYRRYLIPLVTLLLLWKHGFWIDVGLMRGVAEQEGLTSELNQPLLFIGMLALVLLLCSCLLTFRSRIFATPLLSRPTLCLIVSFVALVVIAQSPLAAGLPRLLIWSFLATLLP